VYVLLEIHNAGYQSKSLSPKMFICQLKGNAKIKRKNMFAVLDTYKSKLEKVTFFPFFPHVSSFLLGSFLLMKA